MKSKKSLSVLCVAVVFGCCWTACESDLFEGTGKTTSSLTRSDSVQIALSNIIKGLCETDSTLKDKLEMNVVSFEPNYGMVVYSVTPTVRYVLVESADYARGLFMSKFLPAIQFTKADTLGTNIRINLDAYGSVEYTPMQTNGSLAAIDVNVPQIPNLTQVFFVSPEALPQNGNGQLEAGNVLRYKDGRYWICIRPANYGGLLVTFDRKDGNPFNGNDGQYNPKPTFVNDPFVTYCQTTETSWYPKVNNNSYINRGFPSREQLDALQRFMYNDDGTRRSIAEDAFTFAIKNRGGKNLYDCMFEDGKVYCCGDGADYWDGPTRTYTYSKYSSNYIWPFTYKNGWHDHEYDYTTRVCRTSWYIMRRYASDTNDFFYEDGWETHNVYGSYPQRCISETMNFIRTEMKTFKDYDIFYDPETNEGRNGWEPLEY
ncbi:MAG: hypothetical protein K6B45_09070 [Bacteroidaceae bacterium]|nr:hypothetical protein [Bacteroidaceae bacterium]